MGFFAHLLDLVFPPRPHEEIVRTLSADALLELLSPALMETTRPATVALLPFCDTRVRALIHEGKYRGNARAQELLAGVLAEYLAESGAESFGKTVLIPLPLSPARQRERGFNQCARIAEAAMRAGPLRIPIDETLLIRTKNTEHQARLSREERLKNARGAFGAAHPADPSLSYIVLDDVITTGATMQAAIDALLEAGAKHVIPVAIAR